MNKKVPNSLLLDLDDIPGNLEIAFLNQELVVFQNIDDCVIFTEIILDLRPMPDTDNWDGKGVGIITPEGTEFRIIKFHPEYSLNPFGFRIPLEIGVESETKAMTVDFAEGYMKFRKKKFLRPAAIKYIKVFVASKFISDKDGKSYFDKINFDAKNPYIIDK